MPKISDSKGRSDENSGYARLFGNQQLGQLMSRVQATVIRTGNELENFLEKETPNWIKTDFASALYGMLPLPDIQVVFQAKMPPFGEDRGEKTDIVVIKHAKKNAFVVELKDGELKIMTRFASWLAEKTGYITNFYFCSFNQSNKQAIIAGAKGRFDASHAVTGRELCNILSIDYDTLRAKRQQEQPENLRYFINELLRIEEIRKLIKELWEKVK